MKIQRQPIFSPSPVPCSSCWIITENMTALPRVENIPGTSKDVTQRIPLLNATPDDSKRMKHETRDQICSGIFWTNKQNHSE